MYAAFSIMVGLSLDYDVFLVSRIVEFRYVRRLIDAPCPLCASHGASIIRRPVRRCCCREQGWPALDAVLLGLAK
jgi:hypothetical protein